MFGLPGRSFKGVPPPLTPDETIIRDSVMKHVQVLAGDIGERNVRRPAALARAADYIEQQLAADGYHPASQSYSASGQTVRNIEAELPGTSDELLIVGAHYDSVTGCPGANDNGSGVAALLDLARLLSSRRMARTVRFVAFVNEEPPFFMTSEMGSVVYARRSRARGERIAGMFSLETIGYYSDEPGSQKYPGPAVFQMIYPSTGNFIGFVANVASRKLMRDAGRQFRRHTKFPSEGAAAPSDIPGIGWSDHWSFWQEGYPGVMLTDTAPFRYPHYHLPTDTPDKLDYDSLARVVAGVSRMVEALAQP
jgi:Zn-dependent M28 family amino/carboxypeptidase